MHDNAQSHRALKINQFLTKERNAIIEHALLSRSCCGGLLSVSPNQESFERRALRQRRGHPDESQTSRLNSITEEYRKRRCLRIYQSDASALRSEETVTKESKQFSRFAMVLAELIGALVVALSILYVYYKFVIFNFWSKRDVFSIEPVVPLGNITDLVFGRKQIGIFFQDIYMKYKNHRAVGIYTFFKPNLVITDLDLIRTVMTKEFGSFHDRGMYCNEKIDPLSGHLFLLPGMKWRKLRIKMTPTFTSGKIKRMFAILTECGENLAKHIESIAQMKDSIDIKDTFARYTTDVIMSITMGIKSNCIEEPNNEYRKLGKQIFEANPLEIVLAIFIPKILDFFSIPLTDKYITRTYMNIFRENVENRQRHNIVRHDFMNLLIQLMEKGYVDPDDDKKGTNKFSNVSKLTMEEAAAQSFVFFIAGFETSSTTATFTLFELTQNQEIQDRVRQEIDETLTKHGDLTYDAINEMTYLHKVVNETLRKYPPLPYLTRICTKEINLPTTNVHIPEGTSITIPLLGLHRDPSIYPDPDKYDPERFNADVIAERHPYAYMPFGEGPRICIGARFGYIQTKVGLVNLLSKYKFKLDPRTQVPLIFDVKNDVLSVKGGIHLIVEPR